jgi:hypothetical protein
MMPDVGRVGENQVRRRWTLAAGDDTCEVAMYHVKTCVRPQGTGGIAKARIEFDANGALDPLGTEDSERSGIKAAGADGRIGEVNLTEVSA